MKFKFLGVFKRLLNWIRPVKKTTETPTALLQ
nr:MAG TPA: hypothetical protein [Caudoviricetes sp.]